MDQKKPKFEPPTNVAQEIILGKFFKEGQGQYGKWFGWDVTHEGVEKTWFPTEKVHERLKTFKTGTTLHILKAEKKLSNGKSYTEFEVTEPLFDDKGDETPEPPPSPLDDEEKMLEVTKAWAAVYLTALETARKVARQFNETLEPDKDDPAYALNHEDIRSMAISMVIDYHKKY